MTKKTSKKKTSKTGNARSRSGRRGKKPRVSALVEKALQSFEKRLGEDDLKLTTAEYLKLLQMEQEMEHESPREITVTWVEPKENSDEK